MKDKLSTLLEILNYSADLLSKNGIKDARLNVELLFCHVLSCSRLKLYLDFDKPLTQDEINKFKPLLKRRLKNEPLQYILGSTNFYGYEIAVNPSVLIPRPDTEVLVERFLEKTKDEDNISILEIGTGSGCIAAAVSGELGKNNKKYKYIGIDIGDEAISTATANLHANNIPEGSCILEKRDFLSEDFSVKELEEKYKLEFNYIISNPPYISIPEYKLLDREVLDYEPGTALTDSGDGLVFYRKLFEIKNICDAVFLMEIAYNRKDELTNLLECAGIKDYNFDKDYSGNYRVLTLNR
ncbi:MAG: peptide chain release factor N(5)-glutamine methyltransferase [Ignavibacteria bacterium]|nr:peptide chain release factor N(5)-glutamine methyltransferase [Ignavibacteria bacterium]